MNSLRVHPHAYLFECLSSKKTPSAEGFMTHLYTILNNDIYSYTTFM